MFYLSVKFQLCNYNIVNFSCITKLLILYSDVGIAYDKHKTVKRQLRYKKCKVGWC